MMQAFEQRLKSVDAALLTPLVRQAIAQPSAEISDWTSAPLAGGAANPDEGVIARMIFSGHAVVDSRLASWSIVLKVFARPSKLEIVDQNHMAYWKREALAYQAGILIDLVKGIEVPRCFAVVEYPGEEIWVWMEYVVEEHKQWSLPQFEFAAHDLGYFNGAYLVGNYHPTASWFNTGNYRNWLQWGQAGLHDLRRLAHHPRSWITPEDAEECLRLYAERERLLGVLERLPQCLCHHDAFRRNLMIRRNANGEEKTVAIDWSGLGLGAVGEEIAKLVVLSLYFLEFPAEEAEHLDGAVFSAYLRGLRAAGWQGDEKLVRLGYTAAAGLFAAVTLTGFLLPVLEDEERLASWDEDGDLERSLIDNAKIYRFAVQLCKEALSLL